MINIKPSSALRNNYAKISKLCKETREPVYITKNGESDLTVWNTEAFEEYREQIYFEAVEKAHLEEIFAELALAIKERENGIKGHTIEETFARLKKTLDKADNDV